MVIYDCGATRFILRRLRHEDNRVQASLAMKEYPASLKYNNKYVIKCKTILITVWLDFGYYEISKIKAMAEI